MTAAEQGLFPISELSSFNSRSKWVIKGRVTKRSPLREWKKSGSQGCVFDVDLLDAGGGEIRASFFNDAAKLWYDKMEVGKIFTLSRGSVRLANPQFNSCKHRFELAFDKTALVEECPNDEKIAAVLFHFAALRSLQSKTLPSAIDLCCVIISYEQPVAFTSRDGKNFVKRVLTVADDSCFSMQVTLWGERARKEDSFFDGSPVMAMKGVYVTEWQGGRAGSLRESGLLVEKPTVPEAERVRHWWFEGGGQSETLTYLSQTNVSGGGGQKISGHTLDVPAMRQMQEQISGQEVYNVVCRLSSVQMRKQGELQPLYLTACLNPKEGTGYPCNRRVESNGFCSTCNKAGKVGFRLFLRCRFVDLHDGFWVTTFHEAAQAVIGLNAEQVHEIEQLHGREDVESKVKESYFLKPLRVTLRAKLDNYNGEPRPNVTCINAHAVSLREHGRAMLSEIQKMIGLKRA